MFRRPLLAVASCAIVALLLLGGVPTPQGLPHGLLHAQSETQYRGFWIDTLNTRLNTAADVAAAVDRARAAGANALFVQVRRRGDAWYLQGREPRPEGVDLGANFDPLAETIARARDAGLQVHAFVVVGAIWNQTTQPAAPEHVFNTHGFTPAGPRSGADNWLTRTRLPDGSRTSYGGYRFGADFWLDFGHPDAATYTVDLLTDLVSRYDLDGLHLDRLQYPEIGDGNTSVGYNDVSLQRFRQHYQRESDTDPAADDADWNDWRRAQVTALMRRIYLAVLAVKPRLKVSVGVVANGGAPDSEDGWRASDAYARAFQDWRAWMEEGALDIAVPLAFRAEHTPGESDTFAGWMAWTRDHQYQRHALMGVGAYLNSIEGTLHEIRRAFEPASNPLDGVVLFSLGAHNAPVTRNPLAIPAGRDTPLRSFEDLAAGLRTGRTVAGQALEPGQESASSVGVFATPAGMPSALSTVARGHLLGELTDTDGRPVEGADVTFQGPAGGVRRTTTDGSGTFTGIDLTAGTWRVTVSPPRDTRVVADCTIGISAGHVARLELAFLPSPFSTSCQISLRSRR